MSGQVLVLSFLFRKDNTSARCGQDRPFQLTPDVIQISRCAVEDAQRKQYVTPTLGGFF